MVIFIFNIEIPPTTFVSSFAVLAPITAPTGPAINPPAIDLLIVPFLLVIVFSPIVSIL